MAILGIIGAISSGLKIIQAFTDPDQKEKAFSVAMRKNARKALNTAEDIFELTDRYLDGDIMEKTFRRKYRALKSRFNDLD